MQGKSEPEYATTVTALSRCLVDGDPITKLRDRHRRREALGISFVIESVVHALLIVAPLMTSVAQPQLNRIFPPMPVVMGDWQSHNTSRDPVPHPIHHSPAFLYQDFQPRLLGTVVNSHQDAEQNADSILDFPGEYIPGAIQLTNLGPARLPVEPPSIDTHKTNEKSTVKVSEGVQQAQLVSRIEPRYPLLALQTRKEGTVLLHAIISREGVITAIEVASGSPWFVQAALDAVREWRYRPTYLNGEPVEVETSITVIFRLSQ
jgi:periplasmic protein TonB